jgi:hypothetical protein
MKDVNGSGSTVLLVEADVDERSIRRKLKDEGFESAHLCRPH